MKKILVIGSLNIDLVTYVPHLPQAGETISSFKYFENPGGKGANQAITAAKLGADVHMIGKVGTDSYGSKLINSLYSANVNTEGVMREGDTGKAFINVSKDGENHIVIVHGANYKLVKNDIDQFNNLIKTSELIIMQLEIPFEIVEYVLELAGALQKDVILNPAPGMKLPNNVFKKVHTLIPNESELEILTGMPVSTEEEVIEACQWLRNLGVERIIVTMGAKGSLLINENEQIHIPAFKVKSIDSTGAGDAYIGAFAVGILSNLSDKEAATFANRVASMVVTREGAQPSLPSIDEIEAFNLSRKG